MKFMNAASRFGTKVKEVASTKFARALTVVGGTSAVAATQTFAAAPGSTGVDMTGVTLPFTIGGMLATATNFLGMYGAWIALALGVIFSPVLYGLAMKLVSFVARRFATK